MTVYKIKIYFDTICAWDAESYIGHRTLLQAISLFQKTYPGASSDEWRLTWLPFYRDRTLPAHGVPLEQRLVSAFGQDRTATELARVQRIGRVHGINFNLKSLIGHTRDSHRLIQYAGTQGGSEKQQALLEAIYFRWFECDGDITSRDFLLDCAEAVDLKSIDVAQMFSTDMYAEEVDRLDGEARQAGVTCVPTFDINGTRIEGAQDASIFYETFVALSINNEEEL